MEGLFCIKVCPFRQPSAKRPPLILSGCMSIMQACKITSIVNSSTLQVSLILFHLLLDPLFIIFFFLFRQDNLPGTVYTKPLSDFYHPSLYKRHLIPSSHTASHAVYPVCVQDFRRIYIEKYQPLPFKQAVILPGPTLRHHR